MTWLAWTCAGLAALVATAALVALGVVLHAVVSGLRRVG